MKVYTAVESTTDNFDTSTKVLGVFDDKEKAKKVIVERNNVLYRNYDVDWHLENDDADEVFYTEDELGYSYYDQDGSYDIWVEEREVK